MPRRVPMKYGDAVRLLGEEQSTLVNTLDQALGLGLLALTAFSPASALPYFEVKSELISQLNKLVKGLRDRVQKSGRIEYEKLLIAAHAVIAVTAFTEVMTEQMKRTDKEGKWRQELHQWNPKVGAKPSPGRYGRWQFVQWADQSVIQAPGPTRPLEVVIDELNVIYCGLSKQALAYLSGLNCWDEAGVDERQNIQRTLRAEVPKLAIDRYKEHFVKLATQIPEFMAWTLLSENSATRSVMETLFTSSNIEFRAAKAEFRRALTGIKGKLESQSTALGGLPALLEEMIKKLASNDKGSLEGIFECHKIYQLVLNKPLLEPRLADDLQAIQFPTNEEGYINPNYRIIETLRSDEGRSLAQDDSWDNKTIRQGLGGFLAGYLRSDKATQQPLLILGDPGSGKSLLSKILAAQLPPDEFAVARVELRHVRSSQEVTDQIDVELRRQTNKRYRLQDLTDQHGQITRVVIMDGLDELLQLSPREGLGRYLDRLIDFQENRGATRTSGGNDCDFTYDRDGSYLRTKRYCCS